MRARSTLSLLMLVLGLPTLAAAQAEPLATLESVHEACESVVDRERQHLYTITVDSGWSFEENHVQIGDVAELHVDTRRNLGAIGGRVSLLMSGLEPIAFEADGAQATALREAAAAGAALELGFFLGFDDPNRQPCMLRGAHAVTIVRADLAYVQLARGEEVVARAELDRLRAWSDDRQAAAIPGEGPRGVVGDARFVDGQAAPPTWQHALDAREPRARFGRCHAQGVSRGASNEGQVIVRLNVETRTGRIRAADVALSSIGDEAAASCIAEALASATTLPPAPPEWRAEHVDLTVPVRLAAD